MEIVTDNAADFLHDLGDLHGLVHLHAHARIDEMQSKEGCFVFRQIDAEPLVQVFDCILPGPELVRVEHPRFQQQTVSDQHFAVPPLNGKIDVVGQRQIQVICQLLAQLHLCHGDHFFGCFDVLRRDGLCQLFEPAGKLRHAVGEEPLHLGGVQHVAALFAKGDPAAHGNDILAALVDRNDDIIVQNLCNFQRCFLRLPQGSVLTIYRIFAQKRTKKYSQSQNSKTCASIHTCSVLLVLPASSNNPHQDG